MALLPSAGSNNTVGVLITTTADNGAITTTEAQLQVLGETAKNTGNKAASSFDTFTKNLKTVGQQMTDVGKTMSTYVTAPIVGIGTAAYMAASSFQQQMTYIRTQAGDTTDSISSLSDQVLKLAQNSEFTPDQLAQGLYHLASVGMTGATAINALNAAQQLAAVGGSNLDDTTQALTVAWKSGIKGAQDFQQAAGTMNAIVGAGDMHLQDLVSAMGPTGLLAAAKTAGLSLSDIGATLAQLSDMTGNAQESATHLRQALLLMQSPSKQAADYLQTIGFSATQLGVDLQEKGMMGTLEDLKTHLTDTFGPTALTTLNTYTQLLGTDGPTAADKFANSSENAATVISKAFGGSKSSSVIMQLLTNLDQVNQKEQDVSKNSSLFASDYATTQQTAAYKMHAAYASMMADLVKLGDVIMPQVTHVIDDVTRSINGLTTWFSNLNAGQKQFAIDALGVAAAVGPILLVFGTLATKISGILTLTSTLSKGLGIIGAAETAGGAAGSAVAGTGAAEAGGALVSSGTAAAVGTEIAGGIVAGLNPAVLVGVGVAIAAAFVAHTVAKNKEEQRKQANQDVGLPANSNLSSQATYNSGAAKQYANITGTAEKQAGTLATLQSAQANNDRQELDYLKGLQIQAQLDVQKTKDGTAARVTALQKLQQINGEVDSQQKIVNMDIATANTTIAKYTDATNQHNTALKDLAKTTVTIPNLQNALTFATKQEAAAAAEVHARTMDQKYALDKYGASSPQYAQATANLVSAEQDLSNKTSTAKQLRQDITTIENDNKNKRIDLKQKTQDLTNAQNDLNNTLAKEPHGSLVEQLLNHAGSDLTHLGKDIISGFFHGLHVPGFATGTNYASGGWSMVGENGPEAMYVPQGAMIKSSSQTSGMRGSDGRSGGVTIYQTVNNYSNADMTEANRQLAWQLSGAV